VRRKSTKDIFKHKGEMSHTYFLRRFGNFKDMQAHIDEMRTSKEFLVREKAYKLQALLNDLEDILLK
jgi:hypothetical protein